MDGNGPFNGDLEVESVGMIFTPNNVICLRVL